MTEPNQMPDTPWWSAPGATAVLPTQAPPPAVEPPAVPSPPRRTRRGGTALLLALALIAGGGVGGGVATLLDEDGTTVVQGTPLVGGGVTSEAVEGSPEAAAATISPSVVTIEVSAGTGDVFGGVQRGASTGSGVVLRADGYIVTNNHVVDSAVGGGGTVHVTLADGKTVEARVVGTDPSTDLAVIKVDGVAGLTPATFARSADLKVGQAVLAVGAPLGLSNTVTQGIVSTLNRPVRTGDNQQAVLDAVQTDAAINPGNSGGALVDLAGRVVGINSAIATAGGGSGNIGVGFAIPSEVATKIADQIIASGRATHSQIGVTVADAPSGTDGAPGLGALIRGVLSGGPAARAGLQVGDIVTKVEDRRVTDADSLIVAIRAHDPGDTVTLTLQRDGRTRTLEVTLTRSSG